MSEGHAFEPTVGAKEQEQEQERKPFPFFVHQFCHASFAFALYVFSWFVTGLELFNALSEWDSIQRSILHDTVCIAEIEWSEAAYAIFPSDHTQAGETLQSWEVSEYAFLENILQSFIVGAPANQLLPVQGETIFVQSQAMKDKTLRLLMRAPPDGTQEKDATGKYFADKAIDHQRFERLRMQRTRSSETFKATLLLLAEYHASIEFQFTALNSLVLMRLHGDAWTCFSLQTLRQG